MRAPVPTTDPITIPGYSIDGELGHGGMASVYLATQHGLERVVALKIMSPLLASDPGFAARFKREARIVAQLSHPCIVPLFDVGEHQSRCYLAMEYLPGGNLRQRLLDGPLSAQEASRICTALCAALDLAHRNGFVHRDIKPDNILFREDGTPVLTDFGIARALDHGQSMTAMGVLVGTPGYMSPEQVKGLDLDGRSDLYALGVVFHEMLTGTAPFRADTSFSLALKQVSEPLPRLPPEYAAYQEFLDCLTAKDREERSATGAEVIRALAIANTGQGERRKVPPRVAVTPRAPVTPTTPVAPVMPMASETIVPLPPRAPVTAHATRPAQQKPAKAPASVAGGRTPWRLAETLAVLAIAGLVSAGVWNGIHPNTRREAVSAEQLIPQIVPPEMQTPEVAVRDPQVVIASEDHNSGGETALPVVAKHPTRERRIRRFGGLVSIEQRLAELRAAQSQARDAQIQQLLVRANSEYAAGAYWEPTGANAADDYREVLALRPQYPEAALGARKVTAILTEEVIQSESIHDIYTSRLLINRIKMLQPDQPQLADLQERLEQLMLTTDFPGAQERGRLAQATKYISEANTDLGREPLDARALDDATEQYDRALSTASTAPGLPSLKERLVHAYAVVARAALENNDPQGADRLLNAAQKHNWSSLDLDQLHSDLTTRKSATAPLKEAAAQ